jgi:RNA polymerase sigma factor (sigma-70 family)
MTPNGESTRWFTEEVRNHEGRLRSYLHHAFPDVKDIDDLMQESYLRLWKTNTVEPIRSAKAFLFRVARHLALDILRRNQSSPVRAVTDLAALSVLDSSPSADQVACSREEVELLGRAIHMLPSRCREIIILRKLRCMPQKEIAERLGISEQTVQVQVVRGVKRIGQILRDQGVRSGFGDEPSEASPQTKGPKDQTTKGLSENLTCSQRVWASKDSST